MDDEGFPHEASVVVSAWPGLELASLLADGMILGRGRRLAEQRLTLDTADHRLARAGIVANRIDDGWTLRCASYGTVAFPGTEPSAELLRALDGVRRRAPLVAASRLRRQGRALPITLTAEDGREVVGQLLDEDVSTVDGRRVVSKQRYVTIEGTRELVAQARRNLAVAGMERRVVKALPDTPPLGPPDPAPWPLEDRPLAATVIQRALARSVAKLLAHDPVVRLDLHVEGVHQMRVATRRLRSDLRTFAELVDPLPEGLVEDLKWLGSLLGEVRDLDVLSTALATAVTELDPADARLTNSMLKRLRRQREAALVPLDAAMTSARYHDLVACLVEFAERPPFAEAAAGTAADVLVPLARRTWRKLSRAARAARRADATIDDVHAMRLRAKRFRYAVDALVEVDGDARRHARLVGGLQDVLGEFNDAVTAEAWLRDQAAHEDDPKRAFVLGQLVMRERLRATQRRQAWPEAWKPVRHRGARAWLDG